MRLDGVLGQKRVVSRLTAEMNAGRLAHAYLFVGPAGCGRGVAARALFQAVNCQNQEGDVPCGTCPPCRRVKAGTHEDFLVLAPPSEAASAQIKVEEVRAMIRTMGFAPFAGGTRMVLIRRAENLNLTSANVLLKTLEEPPPNNIIVLTVQDAAEVLPTLLSRCRRMNFAPLDAGLISAELQRRGVEPGAARLKAAMSGGSLGRGLHLDETKLFADLSRLTARLASREGPAGDWAFADEIMREFRAGGRIDRQGLVEALELLAVYFRDAAAIRAGRPQAALTPPEAAPSEGMDIARAAEAFGRVRRAQARILGNASPELTLATLFGRLRRV